MHALFASFTLDFTPCVEKYLSDKRLDEINLEELLGTTHVVGTLDSMCSTDIGLAVASYYVNLLRAQVEKELTFTVTKYNHKNET